MHGFMATMEMMRETFDGTDEANDPNLTEEEREELFDAWLDQEIADCAITIV